MTDFIEIKNVRVYDLKSLDWENVNGYRNGCIEWIDVTDRNGKLVDIVPFQKGDDLPKYAITSYEELVNKMRQKLLSEKKKSA